MNLYIKEVSNHQDLETEELIVLSEETIVSTKIIKSLKDCFYRTIFLNITYKKYKKQ